MAAPNSRPTGRDEVVAAVLDAAGRLFARRGPTAVSLRDIAAEARVNVGLIHRHIGTKDELVAAVLRRPAFPGGVEAHFPGASLTDFVRTLLSEDFDVEVEDFSRIQAQAILDGYDLVALGVDLPGVQFGADKLRTRMPERDAKIQAAALAAFVTGWRTFGRAYLRGIGVDDADPDEVEQALSPLVTALTTG